MISTSQDKPDWLAERDQLAGRFLTTHVGSLPRADDLIAMIFAREEGAAIDAVALAERVELAVGEVVDAQVNAGLDIVNDGEQSKPSYATYITLGTLISDMPSAY